MTLKHIEKKKISRKKINILEDIGIGNIVDETLNKIIKFQIIKYKEHIKDINSELVKFEDKYDKKTDKLYAEFEKGDLEDNSDFFEWTGLYENILLYKERVDMLEKASSI
jgi:hypothetical protein